MRLTTEQLRQGTDLIYYEMYMFVCAQGIHDMIETTREDAVVVVQSLLLEARLLHARNLIEFFDHNPTRDSLLAKDYGLPYELLKVKEGTIDRLYKDLLHLSTKRLERTVEAKQWQVEELDRPLLERCATFARHLLAGSSFGDKHLRNDLEALLDALTRPHAKGVTHTMSPPSKQIAAEDSGSHFPVPFSEELRDGHTVSLFSVPTTISPCFRYLQGGFRCQHSNGRRPEDGSHSRLPAQQKFKV